MHENKIKTLKAEWSSNIDDILELERLINMAADVDPSSLTEEEQADLIVEKLKHPPRKLTLDDELSRIMAEEIAKEIDAELTQRMLDAQSEYRRNVK